MTGSVVAVVKTGIFATAIPPMSSRIRPLRRAFFRFEHLHGLTRHDGRNGVLIHELRVTVTTQKNAEVVEGGHDARQLDAIDEKDRQ